MKINDPNTMYTQRKYSQRMKNNQNNALSNNEFDFQTYQNVQKMSLNSPFDDIYLGNGEMEDQIQSYKEQLIDAKLKNIKLTNEVQKLKELSKTQMSNFYNGVDNGAQEDIQNQTDSLFYKGSNGGSAEKIESQKMKAMEEKYEKKINKYHEKIKALKAHNVKLEDLVLKLKDTLDRANEVFPNFLMQISSNNNGNKLDNLNNTEKAKENPLMVSVGEDPINLPALEGEKNGQNLKIIDENKQLGAENLELKNALVHLEEEIEKIKNERNMVGNDFDNKLKLMQEEFENTNKKNEEILNKKIKEYNEDIIKKKKEIDTYIIEINKLKNENSQYLIQITTFKEKTQQLMEEVAVMEEQIKNKEYLLKVKNDEDNKIIEELKNELNSKKDEYERKINTVTNENKDNINKISELKSEISNLNGIIKNNINENDIVA